MSTVVDVGTPPEGSGEWDQWETAEVRFHGFADLPVTRGEAVLSPAFECLGHSCCVSLYPGGHNLSDDGMVAVYLRVSMQTNLRFTFCLRDKDTKKVMCEFSGHETINGTHNFASHFAIIGALVDGSLILDVRVMGKKQVANATLPRSALFSPRNPIVKNILKMYSDEESADVVFQVGGQRKEVTCKKAKTSSAEYFFHAHRLILQKCAPALAETCGSGAGGLVEVPINDVDPDIFQPMLYYIYGGSVDDDYLEEYAKDFIDAADKYGVVTLKMEAEACYVKTTTLTVENMMDNLLYADSKNCALLKEAVIDFVVKNGKEVLQKVPLKDVPGGMFADLLTAMTRGQSGADDGDDLSTLRVSELRKRLDEKGLDVDGSRETMIAALKESA